MKYYIILLALFMAACGGNSEETAKKEKSENGEQNPQQVDSSELEGAEEPDVNESDADQNEEETALSDCVIDFDAYISDPSGSATNVRKTPGGEVLTEIITDVDHAVHIVGVQGKWFKIDHIEPFGYDEGVPLDAYDIPGQYGWVHQSVLQIGTRNYGGQKISFKDKPYDHGKDLHVIQEEFYGMPINACGDYIELKGEMNGKTIQGWVKKEWICANPLTTCS